MAQITYEVGDIVEIEDNSESGWEPQSVEDFAVKLLEDLGNGNWRIEALNTDRKGIINQNYFHL